ncbi:MAG: LysR family transcriptional regulator [Colwellia sp.]|nr:MAG: LysR family transcriptional regulator [Colwellia sp.]
MNWDDLRYFLALARQGTVSGAGRDLKVRHTTVARRIAILEESLSSKLFDRTPNGYVLTQVGENLMPHACEIEERVNNADREVFGMDTRLSGTLKIASSYDLFTRLITPNIKAFIDKYPDIQIELVSSTSLIDLGSREADIAIRISPKPPEHLIGQPVVTLSHGLYGTQKYLQKKIGEQQLITWLHQGTKPEWAIEYFPENKIIAKVSDVVTMMELVKNHIGIARLPCYVADAEPTLRRLDLPLPSSKWSVWVLSHRDLRDTARVRACREFWSSLLSNKESS